MFSAALVCLTTVMAQATAPSNPLFKVETPNPCQQCARWNQPHAPVHIFGNTWWVGVDGLSVVAIDTGAGVILLDGALPQSVPLVKDSLVAAGLALSQVKLIGNTHTHFDHAGGIAALQRESGATVMASTRSAQALRSGCPSADDPQAAFGCETNGFPPITGPLREVRDGEVIHLGDVSLTAHFTPGHTPGGTSWTWKSCEGKRCLNIVYADSLSAISAEHFRFTPLRHSFTASISKIARLPCDVLLTAHPDASKTLERLSAPTDAGRPDPADRQQCKRYALRAQSALTKRLAQEQQQPKPPLLPGNVTTLPTAP